MIADVVVVDMCSIVERIVRYTSTMRLLQDYLEDEDARVWCSRR